jgi:hypothetical protein
MWMRSSRVVDIEPTPDTAGCPAPTRKKIQWSGRFSRRMLHDCLSLIPCSQCCGSGIFIPYPGSRIPDPKKATKERGEKIVFIPFFVATNFTKLKTILFLKYCQNFLGQFSKNCRTFFPKNCH